MSPQRGSKRAERCSAARCRICRICHSTALPCQRWTGRPSLRTTTTGGSSSPADSSVTATSSSTAASSLRGPRAASTRNRGPSRAQAGPWSSGSTPQRSRRSASSNHSSKTSAMICRLSAVPVLVRAPGATVTSLTPMPCHRAASLRGTSAAGGAARRVAPWRGCSSVSRASRRAKSARSSSDRSTVFSRRRDRPGTGRSGFRGVARAYGRPRTPGARGGRGCPPRPRSRSPGAGGSGSTGARGPCRPLQGPDAPGHGRRGAGGSWGRRPVEPPGRQRPPPTRSRQP